MSAYYKFSRHSMPNPITIRILAVTVVVSLIAMFSDIASYNLRLSLPELWTGEYWRLLSVGLIHGGPLHLLMNMYFLWVIGSVYEPLIGGRWLLALWVVSILGGSIAAVLFSSVFIGVVGASGGCFGLMGGLLAHAYARFGNFRMLWEHPMTKQLIILLILNALITIGVPQISTSGHAGGFVAGALGGYLIAKFQMGRMAPGEQVGALLFALIALGLTLYSMSPIHRGGYHLIAAATELRIEFQGTGWNPGPAAMQVTAEEVRKAREHFDRSAKDFDQSDIYVELRFKIGEYLKVLEQSYLPKKESM